MLSVANLSRIFFPHEHNTALAPVVHLLPTSPSSHRLAPPQQILTKRQNCVLFRCIFKCNGPAVLFRCIFKCKGPADQSRPDWLSGTRLPPHSPVPVPDNTPVRLGGQSGLGYRKITQSGIVRTPVKTKRFDFPAEIPHEIACKISDEIPHEIAR